MNVFDELHNRWFRVFEQRTDEQKNAQIALIPPEVIRGDIALLKDRVKELEAEVSGLHSKTSSHYGPLVLIEKGNLFYRLRGLFVKVPSIVAALTFLNGLLKDEATAKKFVREHGQEVADELKELFNDPTI